MEQAARFQVLFPGALLEQEEQPGEEQPEVDAFGLWQVRLTGSSPPGAEAYGLENWTGAASPGETPVFWTASLPSDPALAWQSLQLHGRQIIQTQAALQAAPANLSRDLRRLSSPGQVAFDLQNRPAKPASLLERARLYQLDMQSFGDMVPEDEIDGIVGIFNQFISQIQGLVGQMALVETTSGGLRQAQTRVSWSGAFDCWYARSAGQFQIDQHGQVLEQALATRQVWLRFLLLFSAGVMRVGAALGAAPFAPLVIWTTWNYLQQLIKEYHRLLAAVGENSTTH